MATMRAAIHCISRNIEYILISETEQMYTNVYFITVGYAPTAMPLCAILCTIHNYKIIQNGVINFMIRRRKFSMYSKINRTRFKNAHCQ